MYSAFLFDMDGTLVDTFKVIYDSFNSALEDNGRPTFSKTEFKENLFGKPVDPTLAGLIGEISDEGLKKLLKDFERHWFRNLESVKIFKDVQLTLKQLKDRGVKLGVVSTSPRDVIEETLREVGIRSFFDVIIGEEDVSNKKPHHEPVTTALNMLRVPPEDAVFVGDTIYDMQAGKGAGCCTVLLLNGHNVDVLETAKPDRVVRDVASLLQLT